LGFELCEKSKDERKIMALRALLQKTDLQDTKMPRRSEAQRMCM
jgi:hypothetical protein